MNLQGDTELKKGEYYKELYEKELKKNGELTARLVDIEAENADLNYKLDKIRKSKLWRSIYPFRLAYSHLRNLITRIRRYGNIRNLTAKIRSKRIERAAYKSYGTLSMPDEETRKKQSETVFETKITFSILVHLYNTPKNCLTQMIDSVVAQTYKGWELCLADASDDSHTYVETIARQYMSSDANNRIKYVKLTENKGI